MQNIVWMLYGAVAAFTAMKFVQLLGYGASSEVGMKPKQERRKEVPTPPETHALAIRSNFNTWLAITVITPIIFWLSPAFSETEYANPVVAVLYVAISVLSVREVSCRKKTAESH